MKLSYILPFVATGTALVVPAEQVLRKVDIEENHRDADWYQKLVSTKDELLSTTKEQLADYYDEAEDMAKDAWSNIREYSNNAIDDAFDYASDAADTINDKASHAASGFESWIESEVDDVYHAVDESVNRPHHKPNQTVFQLIAGSKYTTKLAKLISEFDDLVEALNSTNANFTVFAPSKPSVQSDGVRIDY